MTEITVLFRQLADPALSDAEAMQASDALAAVINDTMQGPGPLAAKIAAVRVVHALGWDALLPGYLALIAAEAGDA